MKIKDFPLAPLKLILMIRVESRVKNGEKAVFEELTVSLGGYFE